MVWSGALIIEAKLKGALFPSGNPRFTKNIPETEADSEILIKMLGMAAVMNLGPQPTVDPAAPSAVEVHLLDRSIQLDGEQLLVEPVQRLRGQKKFSGLDELSTQIGVDAQTARDLLSTGR